MIDADRERELRSAIEDFYFGYRAFTAQADQVLAARGLGRTHHRILYFVRRDADITMSALLDLLGITKQAAHRPIRDLQDQELLTITPDPTDRRARRLAITAKGRALEAELSAGQMRLLNDTFRTAGAGAEASWRAIMNGLGTASSAG